MRVPKKKLFLYWLLIILIGSLSQIYITKESSEQNKKENDQRYSEPSNTSVHEIYTVVAVEDSSALGGYNNQSEYIIHSILFGLLFISFIAILYITLINSSDLREYIDSSLKLAGFDGRLATISRKMSIESGIKIIIYGIKTIKIKIDAPLFDNFLYFGLVEEFNRAVTITNLEYFPVKMQIIKRYLKSNK